MSSPWVEVFLKLPWYSSCQSSEQGKSLQQKKFSKDFGLRAVRLVSGVVVQVLGFKHEIRLTGHNFHSASKETISAGRLVSILCKLISRNGCKNCMNISGGICLSTAVRKSFAYYVDWMMNLSHSFLADRLLIRTWGCTGEEERFPCFRFQPLKPWRTKDNMMIMLTDAQPGQLQEIAKLLSGVLSEFWISDDIVADSFYWMRSVKVKDDAWCLATARLSYALSIHWPRVTTLTEFTKVSWCLRISSKKASLCTSLSYHLSSFCDL